MTIAPLPALRRPPLRLALAVMGWATASAGAAAAPADVHDPARPSVAVAAKPHPGGAKKGAAAKKKGGGKKPKPGDGKARGARAFDDTVLVRPAKLLWPAADLAWQHRLIESLSLEASATAGRYQPLFLTPIKSALESKGINQPISIVSGELGAAWHPNERFHKGFRLGLSLKLIRLETTTSVSTDDGTIGTEVTLRGISPMVWGGFKHSWKSGFTIDYRLGGGPMRASAVADAKATATADGQTLGTAEQRFESSFPAAWVCSSLGLGWSF